MKIFFIAILSILMLSAGDKREEVINQFLSSSDTLVIQTEKQKGSGLYFFGASPLNFSHPEEEFPYSVILPKNISDIKRTWLISDYTAKKRHYIDIISGKKGKEQIFIVDENNNNDFNDDSIRSYKKMKWYDSEDLIKCKYQISDGLKIIEDSSWIRIGLQNGKLFCGRNEHRTATFNIDSNYYQIGIDDSRAPHFFNYGHSTQVALFSQNGFKKDTLITRDILKIGELLNLGGKYYRFEKISTYGNFITLIKEKSLNDKIGTQVGMTAPDFTCISITGDTIRSSELHNRTVVLVNTSGCGGDTIADANYLNIKQIYGDKIHLIAIDFKISEKLGGSLVDMENKFNKDFYYNYRNAYCSRMCYVIDKDNMIIDKFIVYDWKSFLPKHIEQ